MAANDAFHKLTQNRNAGDRLAADGVIVILQAEKKGRATANRTGTEENRQNAGLGTGRHDSGLRCIERHAHTALDSVDLDGHIRRNVEPAIGAYNQGSRSLRPCHDACARIDRRLAIHTGITASL